MTVVLFLAVCCFAAALALAAAQVLGSRRELRASLERAGSYGTAPTVAAAPTKSSRTGAALLPFARAALRLRRGLTLGEMNRRIAAAGLARRISAETVLGIQGVGLALAALMFVLALAAGASPMPSLLALLVLAVGALLLPDRLLRVRAVARANDVQTALPNALDLLAVSVEAGLGLDAAMARVAESLEGPLADELATTLTEIRVGETRSVALQRLAERVDRPELTSFVRSVTRADQLGVSLAETLRVQADEARSRRQSAAEEQAAKAPVRMLIPTTFLIFPPLFVVVLGPAVMSIARLF
jgi:tight adherence protein C